ncbi:hypothetical protein, partial [Candidatus Frankia nodulisporulans]|uniref:hypothetical protein n=1 Tax=Candidatus Frankia nodulisporulans TaxID=2060052 RepID=UPI0037042DB7
MGVADTIEVVGGHDAGLGVAEIVVGPGRRVRRAGLGRPRRGGAQTPGVHCFASAPDRDQSVVKARGPRPLVRR